MPARDRERRDDLLTRRDEAGRVGGRVEKNEPGRRRYRARELVRIEAPAARPVEADRHGAGAGDFERADEIGPRRRRDQRLVAWAGNEPGRDLDCVHAADGDEEILGRESAASGRRAVDVGHVGGDRRAELGHAALVGVECLAAVERGLGRLADERRRRQVALADPQRNEPLPAAAVIEHLDDAARGDVAHRGADLIEPIRIERGRGDVHFRVMDDARRTGKGSPGQVQSEAEPPSSHSAPTPIWPTPDRRPRRSGGSGRLDRSQERKAQRIGQRAYGASAPRCRTVPAKISAGDGSKTRSNHGKHRSIVAVAHFASVGVVPVVETGRGQEPFERPPAASGRWSGTKDDQIDP